MKSLICILAVSVISVLYSQPTRVNRGSTATDVIKVDPRAQQSDFVPKEILVRFKDDVRPGLSKINGLAKAQITTVDALFQRYEVSSASKLIRSAQPFNEKQYITTFSGQKIERPSLHNIYKLQITDQTKMMEALEEFKKDPNVEYAEPNYIFSIVDDKPVSGVLRGEETGKHSHSVIAKGQSVVVPNDPLYSQQWYIPAVQVDAVWDTTQGDSAQIIAFLDTGVDWHHPDLVDNIWTNQTEANGVSGLDDDGDGYVDDIHGWDFINNDNDPMDDNSHGTHVAGIACAKGNNGIGIAGVNWRAKIMPIKVFQSSGRGDAATIAQGITYAANHGATVINMSFGSYARSLTMEAVLANAYATCALVAAAGNDGASIYPPPLGPFYPAAFSFVMGVQAGDALGNAVPPGFSNFDPDGPVYSTYSDLLNYELSAPGNGIVSTVPNGNYRAYSGTSMAAPIVSGAIALYQPLRPGESQELMLGNLINTSRSYINIYSALQVRGSPMLNFVSTTIVDTLDGDKDGRIDAGETIEVWFTIRNAWAQADSVFVGIRFSGNEDTSVAQILANEAFIGSISPYASRTNELHSLKIHFNGNIANNRDVVFEAFTWCKGSPDTVRQNVVLTVENGTQVGGIIAENTTWTADRVYLIKDNVRIATGVTLTISPGTNIIFSEGKKIDVWGSLVAAGEPNGFIDVSGYPSGTGDGIQNSQPSCKILLDYVRFHDMNVGISINWGSDSVVIRNSLFTNIANGFPTLYASPLIFEKNVITDNAFGSYQFEPWLQTSPRDYYTDNLFIRNGTDRYVVYGVFSVRDPQDTFSGNSIFGNRVGDKEGNLWVDGSVDYAHTGLNYWGRTDSVKIKKTFYDFLQWGRGPVAVLSPYLTVPSESSHGHVWKVLVDGIDPQDSTLDAVGVGSHRFDVYFNRRMDIMYTPKLSFGVREPFTQQAVADSGQWSEDQKIWTAYKTVKLYTGDGMNTIRVAGARDPEGFEIPVEDRRFRLLIDAAGTSSVDFVATPGLGKVDLEWNNAGLTDLLGFNMYRFTNVTDTTYSDTTIINTKLITDTLYTDYNVIPGKNYYYLYKVVRTDFSESDYSKVVGAQALTSSAGDANGDLTVNVLDVVAMVSFILGGSPQPFIFAAADVNNDSTINVLDVVGTVNIILHPRANIALGKTTTGSAHLDLVGNTISLTSDVPVAAIQFTMKGKGLNGLQLTPGSTLCQFEIASSTVEDTLCTLVIYSMKGATLSQGTTVLGTFAPVPAQVSITSAIIADAQGHNILTNVFENGKPLIPTEYSLEQNYPNPFNLSTRIQFVLPVRAISRIVIYNLLGQRVRTFELGERSPGRYTVTWDGKNERGSVVSSGVYFYRFESDGFKQTRKLVLIK